MKKLTVVLMTALLLLLALTACRDGVPSISSSGDSGFRVIELTNRGDNNVAISKYVVTITDAKGNESTQEFTWLPFTTINLNEGKCTFSIVCYDSNSCVVCSSKNDFTVNIKKNSVVSLILDGNKFNWKDKKWGLNSSGLIYPRNKSSFNDQSVSFPTTVDGTTVRGVGMNSFSNTTITGIVIPSGYTVISDGAFSGCSKLNSVEIASTVGQIGGSAFMGCSSLKSINLPNIPIINSSCFQNSGLTSITIPTSVTKIAANAFAGCKGLTTISIPSSITNIGDGAFSSCSNLASVTIEGTSLTIVGSSAFSNTVIIEINLPESVTAIGASAFAKTLIKSFKVPSKVIQLNGWIFSGCSELESVTMPNGIKSFGEGLFNSCPKLTSVQMPSSLESIGSSAFSSCTSLTSLEIPNSVKSIGNKAFAYDTNLKSLFVPKSVTNIDYQAFYGITEDVKFEVASKPSEWDDNLVFDGYKGTAVFGAAK